MIEPGDQAQSDLRERPPWIEEAADPSFWDLAFGSYGDGYLEWVTSRYYWDVEDRRSTADTRTLWDKRARYVPELLPPVLPAAAVERDSTRHRGAA